MEKMLQHVFLFGRRSGFEQSTPAEVDLALHAMRRQHQIEGTAHHPGVISPRAPDKFPERHAGKYPGQQQAGKSDVPCTGKHMPDVLSEKQEADYDEDHGPFTQRDKETGKFPQLQVSRAHGMASAWQTHFTANDVGNNKQCCGS